MGVRTKEDVWIWWEVDLHSSEHAALTYTFILCVISNQCFQTDYLILPCFWMLASLFVVDKQCTCCAQYLTLLAVLFFTCFVPFLFWPLAVWKIQTQFLPFYMTPVCLICLSACLYSTCPTKMFSFGTLSVIFKLNLWFLLDDEISLNLFLCFYTCLDQSTKSAPARIGTHYVSSVAWGLVKKKKKK